MTRPSRRGATRATTTRVRPISMIRYMGGLGQSSDPTDASYDPRGPAARAGPHRAHHQKIVRRASVTRRSRTTSGEIAIRTWQGNPEGPEDAGRWGRLDPGQDWVPYQKPTFVTPAFAGLRVRSQHLQSRRRGGAHLHDGQRVLPGWPGRVHRCPRAAWRSRRGRPRTYRCSGPPTTTRPIRRGCPGCTAASTSHRTISLVAKPVPSAARLPGQLASQYFDGTAPTS